jgi:GNAT superfamily N-acetyltransferase
MVAAPAIVHPLLRRASTADVPRLVELNRAAYPDLVATDVVYNAAQIGAHLRVFPEGQIVAELHGALVGALSTFIVPRNVDARAPHTWLEITDHGTFARHDPAGDTLYLADIYTHPSVWGHGVARTLYGALFSLCRELGLARVVAGGRLWAYFEHERDLSAGEYVARVMRGELQDKVLTSQLRAGFEVRGILPGYLDDPRSRSFATLLVWDNTGAQNEPRRPAEPGPTNAPTRPPAVAVLALGAPKSTK